MTTAAEATKALTRLRFTFPWSLVVSANARLMHGSGRLVSQRKYRAKLDTMHIVASGQVRGGGFDQAPVAVQILAYMPDARRRDLTNLAKQPLDALEGVAYADDVQVVRLVMEHCGINRDNPRIEVTVQAHQHGWDIDA